MENTILYSLKHILIYNFTQFQLRRYLITLFIILSVGLLKTMAQTNDIPIPKCAVPKNVLKTLKDAKLASEQKYQQNKRNSYTGSIVKFDWPLVQATGYTYPSMWCISNYVDRNPVFGASLDYNCGTRTYDNSNYNHLGTDIFPAPFGWKMMDNGEVDIVAAADGIIIYKSDGNYDRNCDFSNGNWNAVYVRHSDNSVSMYGHMKLGSLTWKPVNSTVVKGEYLGKIGSSGFSTGPHLHFEVYDSNNITVDPWEGPCNQILSRWNTQKPYNDSGLLRVLSHSSLPNFSTSCGIQETTNEKTVFNINETVFIVAYYRTPRNGQTTQIKVYDSNNVQKFSFVQSLSDQNYWGYYYNNFNVPSNATTDTWRIETTYLNQINNSFITINGCIPPSAPTVNSPTINSGQTATLTASGCTGTVTWFAAATGGSAIYTGNPFTTPALSTNTTYFASCTSNNCISQNRGNGTITVNTCNVAGGTISPATQNLCQDPAVGTSRLLSQPFVLSGYTGNIVRWEYQTPTSGWNGWGQAGVTTPSNCCFGWATGTWKVRAVIGNGSCPETYSTVASVVVLPLPATPTVNSPTITSGQTATLTASGCTGTVRWFAVATGGSAIYTANPFTTPALTTNSTYYAECTANGCASATRGAGTVTVNAVSPCPPTITHSGTVSAGVYSAGQSISSTANVPTNTKYFAGKSIVLLPGFSAGPNENFKAQIAGCIPTNGLVAYYPFTGNANDMSGNANNGTVSGAVLANDRFGVANRAYKFVDGSRINVPNSSSLNLPNAFAFNVWVNMVSTTGRDGNGAITTNSEQCIFTKNCDGGHLRTAIYPQNNTFLLQTYANNGDQITIPFQINQWKMISIVYDGSTLKQYVDGNVISTKATTLNLALTNANDLIIGNMGCWVYYFNGVLDDFRVYNRALTNAEVQAIYVVEKP